MTIILDGTNGITTPKDVEIQGTTSGSITLAAPAVAGSNTQTLVAVTGTLAPIVSGTAVASTSGTSIDFTGIPSYAKRITVMFSGVSTLGGTSALAIQLGDSGGIENTGYTSTGTNITTLAVTAVGSTSSLALMSAAVAANSYSGSVVLTLINDATNSWTSVGNLARSSNDSVSVSAGAKATSAVLDRIRITTLLGVDTFDAGSINILWE